MALDGFLAEFYAALVPGSGDPARDTTLRRVRHEARETSPLTMPLP